MKTQNNYHKVIVGVVCLGLIIVSASCNTQNNNKLLAFKDYPNLKLGLSTQDFQKCIPLNVQGVTEIIEYSAKEGYAFIEIRDVFAELTNNDCNILSQKAKENNIEVIYVIGVNPLDPGFYDIFDKGLANAMLFPTPGILRTMISKSEFDNDPSKKGWSKEELTKLTRISDSCAKISKSQNIQFVVENFNEAFFGDNSAYFGVADFLNKTSETKFQLDIGNLFRNTSRVKNNPEDVLKYLPTIGDRWIITHLKTIQGGEPQPILTENLIPVEKIIELMGKQNVLYVMLELSAVDDKQKCFENHSTSIEFLINKGILKDK